MAYKGSVEIASGLIGVNGTDIPLVHESSIQIGDNSADRLDTLLDSMQIKIDSALQISGGIMEGPLLLANDPTENNEAVTKKYVDAIKSESLQLSGGTMTGKLVLATYPVDDNDAATKEYVDLSISKIIAGDFSGAVSGYLPLSGGTMTGALILHGYPTDSLGAATKQYVDDYIGDINAVLDIILGDSTTDLSSIVDEINGEVI